jgi:hypothetical protein
LRDVTASDTLIMGASNLAKAINAAAGLSTIHGDSSWYRHYDRLQLGSDLHLGICWWLVPTDTLTLAAPAGSTDNTNLTNICNALAELL